MANSADPDLIWIRAVWSGSTLFAQTYLSKRLGSIIVSYKPSKWCMFSGDIWAWALQNQKMTCAPSEDSDQPGHPPSLIRVIHWSHKETLGPSLPIERTAKTLIRLGGCPGWSESLLGVQAILLVSSCLLISDCVSKQFEAWKFDIHVPGEIDKEGNWGWLRDNFHYFVKTIHCG